MAPVLLVMNARILLTGPGGSKELPIQEFFSADGKAPLSLNQGEILTEIIIPAESVRGICIYKKFANRDSIDFPIVGSALWASEKKKEYRVAFTAVDRKPLRAQQVEAFLKGKTPDQNTIKEASDLAAREAKPLKTSVYSPSHKKRMMGLLFHSAVNETMRRSI
jgi:CO/xanthine dehydrogenase FAD-binding subunit